MLSTPQDIITLALKAVGVLGVGQTALAEDNNDVFNVFNAMIGSWNAKRWLIYQLVDYGFTSTGAQSYTVGPGGNFSTPARATRLEFAYFRQFVNGGVTTEVDYPLEILQSHEDYANITLKTLQSWPAYIFYDPGFPLGNVYPWPIPQASLYELHIGVKQTLSQFTSLVQAISLPEEYFEPLWSNLACRLPAIYPGASVTDDTRRIAVSSLEVLRVANTQVPRLSMPVGLSRPALYNIFSDQTY